MCCFGQVTWVIEVAVSLDVALDLFGVWGCLLVGLLLCVCGVCVVLLGPCNMSCL